MYKVSIIKLENRRSGEDRRESMNTKPKVAEKRTGQDRRISDERRRDIERRAGLYYKFDKNQNDIVDRIRSSLVESNR